jgi:hypothetical protein
MTVSNFKRRFDTHGNHIQMLSDRKGHQIGNFSQSLAEQRRFSLLVAQNRHLMCNQRVFNNMETAHLLNLFDKDPNQVALGRISIARAVNEILDTSVITAFIVFENRMFDHCSSFAQ